LIELRFCPSRNCPTLFYPDHLQARALFALLGQVRVPPNESRFILATAIAAFYGWVYALLDEVIAWTAGTGVPPQVTRSLVLETIRGAAAMGLAQPDQNLATPGGITECGLNVLHQRGGLAAWTGALEVVLSHLRGDW
jgi:pyrroline-5-carboxylate reductase